VYTDSGRLRLLFGVVVVAAGGELDPRQAPQRG